MIQEVGANRFQDNQHMKVVRLSALSTGSFYTPGNIPGTHFYWRLSQPQDHSAAKRLVISFFLSRLYIWCRKCCKRENEYGTAGTSSVFVQQMTSSALRREIARKGGICESEWRRGRGGFVSSRAATQILYELFCRLCERVPCLAGRSVLHR